jgi:hypothetical protein
MPDKRARIRAIFAKSLEDYITWRRGVAHGFLHLSVFFFVTGVLIYLFNINRAVFYAVVWCVGYVTMQYTVGSMMVFFYPYDLIHTPLSPLALRIYLGISYVVSQVCSCLPPSLRDNTRRHYRDLSNRYSEGILTGKRRQAEESASKPSSEIDSLILERILLRLDEDRALETFFDAIPGFCNSKSSDLTLSSPVQTKLRQALDGFLNRTLLSNLVSESIRASRLITCLNAAHAALGPSAVLGILDDAFNGRCNEALQSVEIGHALRLWGHRRDYDLHVQQIVAGIIARARQRDERWTMLVKEEFGVPDDVLRDSLTHGDSTLLFILIHISRQTFRTGSWTSGILSSLSNFDIRKTLPGLQHDFCTLWNEFAQEARKQGSSSTPTKILHDIRHIFVALHQGTDATLTPPFSFTDSFDSILFEPSSYPLCDIANHRPDSTTHVPVVISGAVPPTQPGDSPDASPHQSTLGGATALRLAEQTNFITGLPSTPDPSTISEIGEISQAPTITFLGHSSSPSSDMSPREGVATAQPDTTSAGNLSHLAESNEQQGPATPFVAPMADISGIPSTVLAPAPVPTSNLPVLNKSSAIYEASPAFPPKSSFAAPSGGFSAPDSPPSPHVPPLPSPQPLSLLSGMSPKGPSDNAALLPLHPRVLVDNGNMYLINAVLQSLVYCPPFRDLFRGLGRLVGQCEGGGAGGDATPLIDTTVRFLNEFAYKEKSSLTHQVARGKVKKEDDGVHSLLSTDVYDAMKEKRQFIIMRVRPCVHVMTFCF